MPILIITTNLKKRKKGQRHCHFEDNENMKLTISWCQNNMKTVKTRGSEYRPVSNVVTL